jgi:hypothetical protein
MKIFISGAQSEVVASRNGSMYTEGPTITILRKNASMSPLFLPSHDAEVKLVPM